MIDSINKMDISVGHSESLGRLKFSFAIISDTHMTEEDGVSSSPWPSNKLANGRAVWAFREIENLNPAFILHLGDLVHPVPAQASYGPAAERYKAATSAISCPIYVTPGNHDIGDKPVTWAPAGTIQDEYIKQFESFFGPSFHAFSSNGCRFIILNASLLNSGLAQEKVQREWLEEELRSLNGQRCFLSIHYPPYVCTPDEAGGYDNIDEPARSWLLELIAKYKPEAMFSGHVHNFWYDVYEQTQFYILPSTAFVRQDYSEIYRTGPGPENGRDDTPKLGFAMVDVYEGGHVVRVIRSFGAMVDGAPLSKLAVTPVHSRSAAPIKLGVDLRHPWADVIEIPANGGVDEFARKFARNDYPLQAIWEFGLRKLRVPVNDLFNAASRERMRLMCKLGAQFTVFCFGIPFGPDRKRLVEYSALVHDIEVVTPWPNEGVTVQDLQKLRKETGIPVFVSKLRRGHAKTSGNTYSHSIRHGFVLEELDDAKDELKCLPPGDGGIVLRIGRDTSAGQAIMKAASWTNETGIKVRLMVRLAGDDPAGLETDDVANATRVAEAAFAAWLQPEVDVFFDTFDDVDRGYFATNGLVDRRYNPRPAGTVVRNLQAALVGYESQRFQITSFVSKASPIVAQSNRETIALLVPGALCTELAKVPCTEEAMTIISLMSGKIEKVDDAVVIEPMFVVSNRD